MNKIKRYMYITVGLMAFVLGAIGLAIPILPTTPFLLLASFCFVRGSERINIWFTGTSIYKKHLESFLETKAMPLKQKIYILFFTTIMISIPIILIDSIHVKIFLMILIIIKIYYFIFRVKTIIKEM